MPICSGMLPIYFAQTSELNAFLQTWSLGVEEQFYFIFPFALWFGGLRPGVDRPRLIIPIIVSFSIASLIAFVYLNKTGNQPVAFFMMPARIWELGIGSLLFLASTQFRKLREQFQLLSAASPTAVLFIMIITLFSPPQFEVEATIAVVFFTAMLIGLIRPQTLAYTVLTSRPAVYIGLISYSLYLWHWSILAISRLTIGVHLWTAPVQIGLMLLLAIGSYRLVEEPLRRAEWSSRQWQTIGYGLFASTVAAGLLIAVAMPLSSRLYAGNNEIPAELTASSLLKSSWVGHAGNGSETLLQQIETCIMTPQSLAGPRYRPKPQVDRAFIERCTNSRQPAQKILLLGDSFAEVSAPHVALATKSLGYDFKFIIGYGCPYPLRLANIKSSATQVCRHVDESFLANEITRGLKPGDFVVLRLNFPKTQYLSYGGLFSLPPVDAYDAELLSFYLQVAGRGAHLLIMGANPILSQDTYASAKSNWFQLPTGDSFSNADTPQTAYFLRQDQHLRRLFSQDGGPHYFSTADYLCGLEDNCILRKDGKLLYIDFEHLSPFAHDLFYPALLNRMSSVLEHSSAHSRSEAHGGSRR